MATFSLMPILSLKLQVHDALIGLLGSVLAIAGTLVYAFADKWWMMYLGGYISDKNLSDTFELKLIFIFRT